MVWFPARFTLRYQPVSMLTMYGLYSHAFHASGDDPPSAPMWLREPAGSPAEQAAQLGRFDRFGRWRGLHEHGHVDRRDVRLRDQFALAVAGHHDDARADGETRFGEEQFDAQQRIEQLALASCPRTCLVRVRGFLQRCDRNCELEARHGHAVDVGWAKLGDALRVSNQLAQRSEASSRFSCGAARAALRRAERLRKARVAF
ncbi:MAG: hypothetical protein QOG58_3827, partial [Caballeronia sp.]|nr:hypothetical protein [Caballeronia sp.]